MTENPKLAKRQIAVEEVAAGSSHKEVAAKFGLKLATLYSWCSEDGVLVNPRASERDVDHAMSLLVDGHSIYYASRETGYHYDTVKRWARARGILPDAQLRGVRTFVANLSDESFRRLVSSELKRRGLESV